MAGFVFGGFIRDFLDAILAIIGAESLTDAEYLSLDLQSEAYSAEVYSSLLGILDSRETVSNTRNRLTLLFEAHGLQVNQTPTAKSEILIGGEA